jgi:hypothetical protein
MMKISKNHFCQKSLTELWFLKYIFLTIMFRSVKVKKGNSSIFFCAKNATTGRGPVNVHVFQVIYLIFLMSEKEVDKILS